MQDAHIYKLHHISKEYIYQKHFYVIWSYTNGDGYMEYYEAGFDFHYITVICNHVTKIKEELGTTKIRHLLHSDGWLDTGDVEFFLMILAYESTQI